MIKPVRVATRFNLAKKKNIPAAVMIRGTIIGEIMSAIIKRPNGICRFDNPRAASVPNTLAKKVAKTAIKAVNNFFDNRETYYTCFILNMLYSYFIVVINLANICLNFLIIK